MVAKLWQRAINEVSQLSEQEQEEIAEIVLSKVSEKQANAALPYTLRELLEEARRDHAEGRTQQLDPDNLL